MILYSLKLIMLRRVICKTCPAVYWCKTAVPSNAKCLFQVNLRNYSDKKDSNVKLTTMKKIQQSKKDTHRTPAKLNITTLVKNVSAELHPDPKDNKQRTKVYDDLITKLSTMKTTTKNNEDSRNTEAMLTSLDNESKTERDEPELEELFPQDKPKDGRFLFLTPDGKSPDYNEKIVPKQQVEYSYIDWWVKFDEERSKQVISCKENSYFELLRLTQEGKMWEFPINNEAGLEEEKNVPFHKHVFLHEHLEGFPTRGAIRLFMEAVVIGLSNNSWLTVKEKIEYIDWFRMYFKEKYDLLKQLGTVKEENLFETPAIDK